jgi:competence protein ComEA
LVFHTTANFKIQHQCACSIAFMSIPNLPNLDARLFKYAAAISLLSVAVGLVLWWQGRPVELELQPAEVVVTEIQSPVATIFVHVVGDVAKAGVYELAAGSRVVDAIAAAGGPLRAAKLINLNLARVLFDGEQIIVGNHQLQPNSSSQLGKVNLNLATSSQLDQLPGIGPVIAARILQHRDENGPFRQISDIQQVAGIGDVIYSKIKDQISVS